jgi:hypothetical protein
VDINKVWLSGVVTKEVKRLDMPNTFMTIFEMKVLEHFINKSGIDCYKANYITVENFGKCAERTLSLVHKGARYVVEGYVRSSPDGLRIRSFTIYPDKSLDVIRYKDGIQEALEIMQNNEMEKAKEILNRILEDT